MQAVLAPAIEHRQSVDFGQAEIEHDRVIAFGAAEIMAIFTIAGRIDGIAGAFQRRFQLALQIGFVLDDQYAHGGAL